MVQVPYKKPYLHQNNLSPAPTQPATCAKEKIAGKDVVRRGRGLPSGDAFLYFPNYSKV